MYDKSICLAKNNDAQQIAQVHVASWKETYTGIIHQEILDALDVEQKTMLWEQILSDSNHHVLVYIHNQKIMGFLDGYLNLENDIAEIRAFYLLKEIQKQGLGRELFQQFYQIALNHSYGSIRLEVFNKNSSRFFYEKLGAQCIGEEALPEFGEGIIELFYQWNLNRL